jgi:hypothetical protein
MEMVEAVGRGHEALEAGNTKAEWSNTWKANVERRKGAWEKPPLFLMGMHTSADKGSVKVAGGERGNTPPGMLEEEAREGQRHRLYELGIQGRTSMCPGAYRAAELPTAAPTVR